MPLLSDKPTPQNPYELQTETEPGVWVSNGFWTKEPEHDAETQRVVDRRAEIAAKAGAAAKKGAR